MSEYLVTLERNGEQHRVYAESAAEAALSFARARTHPCIAVERKRGSYLPFDAHTSFWGLKMRVEEC
jgi:hypothetical protein